MDEKVMIVGLIVNAACLFSGRDEILWTRAFRPVFLCAFPESRQIRRGFRSIRRTVPDVFNVIVLLFLTIGIFAILFLQLFSRKLVPNELSFVVW